MQQWARIAILGAMFVVAYLLILAWQKDYGHVDSKPQQTAAVVSHEVSADLPNGQTVATSSDVPQANIASQRQQMPLHLSVNSLFQLKLIFIIFGLMLKVAILFVLNYSIMTKIKTVMNLLLCWKAMLSVLMLLSLA